MPKVSLIMPFYQSEHFLREALLSLIAQQFADWELLAIDDFSTDGGPRIVQDFASNDSRIRYIKNQQKGIIPALQLGLKKAQGKYIGRFDSDDLLPPERLLLMLNYLDEAPPKSIVTGLVQYFSDRPISRGYIKYQAWINELNLNGETWEDIYRECVIASPNWIMRRGELLAIGGFSKLEYPEDYDWCFRCYAEQFEVHCIGKVTLQWREHPDRTSRNSEHYQQAAFFKLKLKRFLELESFEELILWGSGRKARISAAYFISQAQPFRWMDLDPSRFPSGILGVAIEDYRLLQNRSGLKVLIGVYPNPSERQDLETFLSSRQLQIGQDYWYL